MIDLIKSVRAYRLTGSLSERQRLGTEIFKKIAPDLHLFVFSRISDRYADDVFQEVLKAVATSLKNFKGTTEKEFWSFTYSIARFKLKDAYRANAKDPEFSVAPEDLREMIDSVMQDATPALQHDLDYAMQLLEKSKPECRDLLWDHFVTGLDYAELGEDRQMTYDSVRMQVARCLQTAKSLMN